MGQDRIACVMKRMATVAGLEGGKTNHSAHKTMVTSLTNSNVPETQIIQLSSYRNLQSLNSYKKASLEQQRDMSHILGSYKEPTTTSAGATVPKGNFIYICSMVQLLLDVIST